MSVLDSNSPYLIIPHVESSLRYRKYIVTNNKAIETEFPNL